MEFVRDSFLDWIAHTPGTRSYRTMNGLPRPLRGMRATQASPVKLIHRDEVSCLKPIPNIRAEVLTRITSDGTYLVSHLLWCVS